MSGNAAQLTATNGLPRRASALVQRARDQLLAGAALALISTGAWLVAMVLTRSISCSIWAERPTTVSSALSLGQLRARIVQLPQQRPVLCDAARRRNVISSMSNGLVR